MPCSFGRATLMGGSVEYHVGRVAKLTVASMFLLHANLCAQARDVLTLGEAITLVSEDQPQLSTLAYREQAALESARAEKELPDPKVAFGVENLPVTGDSAFSYGREEMTMLTVGVMQEVVTRAKRDAASARMSAEAQRLSAERELAARTIQRDVALAWLEAFEAQQRAAALRKLTADMAAARQVSAAQISSGTKTTSEVLAFDVELSATRDELILAERDEARARAALSRWIGSDAVRPLPAELSHELSTRVDFLSAARDLGSHPVLASVGHAIEAANSEVERARAERTPDWGWQLMYGQRPDDRSDMVTLQVTVGLPWNRVDRQNRRVAEKLAEASAMRSESSDRQRMLEADLASVEADLTASAKQLREHEERRVPAARARLDTAEAAYAGGTGALADIWQARRAWIDASLHHQMILADRARALARLVWLTGEMELLP